MLPIALYICCQLDTDVLLNDVPLKDGTLDHLTPGDVRTCVYAQHWTLVYDNVIAAHNVLAPLAPCNCMSPACVHALDQLRNALLKYYGRLGNCDCVADWVVSISSAGSAHECIGFDPLCPECRERLCTRANAERRDPWLMLPIAMDLPYVACDRCARHRG